MPTHFQANMIVSILGIVASIVSFIFISCELRRERTIRLPRGATIILLAISIILILITYSSNDSYILNSSISSTQFTDDLSLRIDSVSNQLSSLSKELSAIQTELENRIATVEKLKEDAEIAENVISLSKEQVEAVQATLNQELEKSSSRSTLISILISAVFFILGYIVNSLLGFAKKKSEK